MLAYKLRLSISSLRPFLFLSLFAAPFLSTNKNGKKFFFFFWKYREFCIRLVFVFFDLMLTEFKRFFTMPLNCFHFLPQKSTNESQISTWLLISRRLAKSVCSGRRMKWRKGEKKQTKDEPKKKKKLNERCSKKQQGVSLSLETSSQITRPILTRAFNAIVRLHSSKCKKRKRIPIELDFSENHNSYRIMNACARSHVFV